MDKKKVKKTSFPYRIINTDDLPAPALNIDIISNNVEKKGILALLDSGSGLTIIPQNIIEEIQPPIIDTNISFGFIGGEAESLLYSLKIRIPEVGIWHAEVASYPYLNYILIGRDILNKWSLFLKGPSEIFEIS